MKSNNMKLFATIQSERGKEVTKSGNDFINIVIYDKDRRIIYKMIINAIGGNKYEYNNLFYSTRLQEKVERKAMLK